MTIEHPYLTDSEMREICAPLTRSCAIRRWFERNGFVTKTTKQKYLKIIKKTLARIIIPCIILKMEATKQPTPTGGE